MAVEMNHVILALLFLCNVLAHTSSYKSQIEKNDEYSKWLSWNIEKYEKKSMLKAEALQVSSRTGSTRDSDLDKKLRMAEMNSLKISVSQDGKSDFQTIKDALNSIPLHNSRRVILDIKPGVYREKIFIPKTLPFITFLGDASQPPTITGNDTATNSGRTFQSATVTVNANYFVAINMKFENTAPHDIGSKGEQAVALRISGTKAAFYKCSFVGSQDTLYDHKGLHYFNNCSIHGSVDFIFGYATSLYEKCQLVSTAKKVASVTAQKRKYPSWSSGFSFKDCVLTGSGHVYLGRAWGDYSRVVFSYTFMDDIVLPQGWSDWGKTTRDSKVYYGEYKCSGPGANMTGRVPWARILTDKEARPFLGTYYVDGDNWLIDPYVK